MTDQLQNRLNELKEKIQRLLALSSNNPNQNEAEVAAQKAQELLQKYNIDLAEVLIHKGVKAEDIEILEARASYSDYTKTRWKEYLATVIGKGYMTEVLGDNTNVWFIGRAADTEISAYVFTHLQHRLAELVKIEYKKFARQFKEDHDGSTLRAWHGIQYQAVRLRWINSWLDGAVAGIRQKLYEQSRQYEASTTTALALRPKDAIDQYLSSKYPKMTSGRNRRSDIRNDHNAFQSGYSTGKELQINQGLPGSKPASQLKG